MLKKFMATLFVMVTIFLFSCTPKVSAEKDFITGKEIINIGNHKWILHNLTKWSWGGVKAIYDGYRILGVQTRYGNIIESADKAYQVSVENIDDYYSRRSLNYFMIQCNGYWYACYNPGNLQTEYVEVVNRGSLHDYIVGLIEKQIRDEAEKARLEEQKIREHFETIVKESNRAIDKEKSKLENEETELDEKLKKIKERLNNND